MIIFSSSGVFLNLSRLQTDESIFSGRLLKLLRNIEDTCLVPQNYFQTAMTSAQQIANNLY